VGALGGEGARGHGADAGVGSGDDGGAAGLVEDVGGGPGADHHGNLRAALLDQAERNLRERGTDALSLRELAREVGVSHAAPRRHFADRQALLTALAEVGFERLGTELATAGGRDGPFADRLLAVARAYVRFATDDAALLSLMVAAKHGEDPERIDEAAGQAFAVVLDLIHTGQADGLLEPGDPDRVGMVLLASIHGIASLVTSEMLVPEHLDRTVEDSIARFLRGAPV
jgi:AcrR family transcriptional regulator